MDLWIWIVALIVVVAAVGGWLVLRRRPAPPPPAPRVDPLLGAEGVALESIASGRLGKVEVNGTAWNARVVDGRSLAKGTRCRVERVEGLTVFVRAR